MRTKSSKSQCFVFESPLGWTGVVHYQEQIQAVKFGFAQQHDLVQALGENDNPPDPSSPFEQSVQSMILSYAEGDLVDLTSLKIDTSGMSPFQERVSRACQTIPRGQTVSYGALAKTVESPGAARAVGSAMRRNKIPLIVPCHRVVPSNGTIGQFSAGQGVTTKKRLLDLEKSLVGPAS